MRRLVTVVVAVTAVAGSSAGVGQAAAGHAAAGHAAAAATAAVVPPSRDAFYAVPSDVAHYRPGAVIRSRAISPLSVPGGLPVVRAWQVAYRTNDGEGAPTATVATVIVPERPWGGRGARPLMAYQSAEDGVGIDCAPSYAWRNGIAAGLGAGLSDPLAVAPALAAGWAVVVPDYEGPQGMFGVGRMAGHGVLDGIRAALRFAPDGLREDARVAAFGYSGGGLATGWAGELQGSYAPELNYVATAGGGTPAKLLDIAKFLTGPGNYASGLGAAGVIGILKQYPHLRKFLNDKGRALFAKYENACAPQLVTGLAFLNIRPYTNSPDLFSEPEVVAVMRRQSMGSQAPKAPVANYHGMLDEIVPFPQDKKTVTEWCARGASVDVNWAPLAEHGSDAFLWYLDGYRFLNDRFAGKPAANDCGSVASR